MYRILFIVMVALAIFTGLLLGTLNSEPVTVDLLWLQVTWPLGLLILSSAAVGALAAFLVTWMFNVLPLRVRLRKLQGGDSARPAQSLNKPNA